MGGGEEWHRQSASHFTADASRGKEDYGLALEPIEPTTEPTDRVLTYALEPIIFGRGGGGRTANAIGIPFRSGHLPP